MNGNRAMGWLARREVLRVSKLWSQTILASVVSSFLFILVFGLSLGGRIKQVDGVDYEVFIVPGLIAMAMVQAAYANNASTIFQGRSDRFINDVLSAPMKPWQMTAGYVIGGIFRGFAIAIVLLALALPITGDSVDLLSSPWVELSLFNPIFYMLLAIRYGFLGTADVSIWLSLGVTAALAIPCYLWAQWLFTSGRKLKA